MNKSNDETLKAFLQTAAEDDLFRAIHFEFDSISRYNGLLSIHLINNGADKEIFLNSREIINMGIGLYNIIISTELMKIAVDQFRITFGLPTVYGSTDFTENG